MSKLFPRRDGIVFELGDRQIGSFKPSLMYHNTRILRKIVNQPETTFQKLWESHSKKTIYLDSRRLYFENYTKCFSTSGFARLPRPLYALPPPATKWEKIADGLCFADTWTANETGGPLKACHYFLGVTYDNFLFQINGETGESVNRIYLGMQPNFRHMAWETEGYTVVIKSVITFPAFCHLDSVCTLIFMNVFPLEFIGMMKVSRKVFGKAAVDVSAWDGLLIVTSHTYDIFVYNLQYIYDHCIQYGAKLNEFSPELGGVVGKYPHGFPRNIQVEETPPVLFRIRCAGGDLQFGGYPWQYLIQPLNQENMFHVYTVEPPWNIENSSMSYDVHHIEPDRAIFHPDQSGKIIHFSSSELRILKVIKENKNFKLRLVFDLGPHIRSTVLGQAESQKLENHVEEEEENEAADDLATRLRTRRNRGKRNVAESEATEEAFRHVVITMDYEDELDLISVLLAEPGCPCGVEDDEDVSEHVVGGRVHMYDNKTGEIVKIVRLQETWEEDCEHNLILDCDLLFHIFKSKYSPNSSSCYIYALTLPNVDD